MSSFIMILLVVAIGVLIFASGYTWSLAKNQKNGKGEMDSKIPGRVQKQPYIRNPIFLTYFIFFLLVILTIIFSALAYDW